MSTSTHPIIILYDFDVEDALSSTNTPIYTPASPNYSPPSQRNTSSDPSEESKDRSASLTISPFHDDPYMKIMQANNDTNYLSYILYCDDSYLYVSGITMVLLPFGFLEPLCPGIMDMINNQDIEHVIPPTPPRDTEPPVRSPISLSPMAPKRTSTSAAPPMTQATIKKLVADSVAAALEAQAATMTNNDNTNRNTRQRETPITRKCSYKEFVNCQPFHFKGTEGVVGLIRWFERTELVFLRSNCTEDCKVKFATSTLTEEALSWWNSFARPAYWNRGSLQNFIVQI
ncbi:hypothetical protein Tco_0644468 [Tanacetum coccineum]